MATLIGNAKYGPGHKVILKEYDKIPSSSRNKFSNAGYTPGTSVFEIANISPSTKIKKIIDLGTGKENIFLKDKSNNFISVIGSASSINGTFNHFSNNAKSNTGELTRLKEEISMGVFQTYVESKKILTEDEITSSLSSRDLSLYDTIFYTSAIKQLNEIKKYVNGNGYNYERQGGSFTKKLYDKARKLTGLANDNWNPADVWMVKDFFSYENMNNINEINTYIMKGIKSKTILPISLKQITANATSEIIDPSNIFNHKLDLDLSFDKVDLSNTFNNFIVSTKSGFAARVGFKASSSTLNVSIEGRMLGAGYQLGAVDAKKYSVFVKDNYNYDLRSGVQISDQDINSAMGELKEIFKKYNRISNTIKSFEEARDIINDGNELTKKRFCNLVSYLYSFLILPAKFTEHMKFCYFLSKKMSSDSSPYIVIK